MTTFCFVLFANTDLVFTGNQGMMVWKSHLVDMYDVFTEQFECTANYFPTTYIMFAIWNLPLKLIGISCPESAWDSRVVCTLWFKTLTTLIYISSSIIIYKIALLFDMQARKAKICMFAFLTFPVAFYCQFIYSQYDIFTVFFMLCGMYFYYKDIDNETTLKKNMLHFCIFFGLATTCKYYAVLIFFVLLLLREKKILKIIIYSLLMIMPLFVELVIYLPSESFNTWVLGFHEIAYAMMGDFKTGVGTISLFQVVCCMIILWAYFTNPKDKNNYIGWSMFLCSGICFALFGLMIWNAQWLLFAAPFWLLGMFINKHCNKFLIFDIVFVVLYYMNICRRWISGSDDGLLANGILRNLICSGNGVSCRHSIYYMGHIDPSLVNMAIFVLLLAYFVFMNPRNILSDLAELEDANTTIWLVRLGLIVTVGFFAIPTLLSLRNTITHNYQPLGIDNRFIYKDLSQNDEYKQTFSGCSGKLDAIMLQISKDYINGDTGYIVMELWDDTNNTKLYSSNVDTSGLFTGEYARVSVNSVELDAQNTYSILISSPYSKTESYYQIYTFTDSDENDSVFCTENGVKQTYDLGICLDMG